MLLRLIWLPEGIWRVCFYLKDLFKDFFPSAFVSGNFDPGDDSFNFHQKTKNRKGDCLNWHLVFRDDQY